jgi:ParB-like nuclease domain
MRAREARTSPATISDHERTRALEPAAEWLPIYAIHPWKGNPRKNDGQPVAKVAASIKRFGFGAPIVARKANGEIIAGHTRWKAAVKLGLARVPVRYLDLDARSAHALALADNRLGEFAEWDESLLDQAMGDVSDEDRALLDGPDPEAGSRADLEVHEVDVSDALEATFYMVVRGKLPAQPDVIARLRAALAEMPGVEVELGGVE